MTNTELIRQEIEKRIALYDTLADAAAEKNLHNTLEANELLINTYKGFLSFIDSLQQEQPEVDLEKFTEKIKTFQGRYKYPESISIKGAMAFMARLFYQYPNTAREWYESLPKVTMD